MSSSPAATRVFNITELLEKILIRVAHPSVHIDVWVADALAYVTRPRGPSRQLFVLQGVSRTFKLTIRDSVKLARRMFLANLRNINYGNHNILLKYVPVLWLLNFLRKTDAFSGFTLEFRLGDSDAGDSTWYHCKRGEAMIGEYVSKRLDKGASWRDIPASNTSDVQRLSVLVYIKRGASSGPPSHGTRSNKKLGYFERRRNEDYDYYIPDALGDRATFSIDGRQTLGDFFDDYVKALEELRP